MHSFLAIWCVFICFATSAFGENDTQLMSHTFKLGEKQYFLKFEAMNFDDSNMFCKAYNMQLATIENLNENTILINELKKIRIEGDTEVWTSGKKISNTNNWIWLSTMEIITSFDWGTGEPNNEDGNEFCLAIYPNHYGSGSWNDKNCLEPNYPICQSVS